MPHDPIDEFLQVKAGAERKDYGPGGKWIYERAHTMMSGLKDQYGKEKGEQIAYAVATQQAHKVGKSPKGFRTSEGVAAAKEKYQKPRSEYLKKAAEFYPWVGPHKSDQPFYMGFPGVVPMGLTGAALGDLTAQGLGARGLNRLGGAVPGALLLGGLAHAVHNRDERQRWRGSVRERAKQGQAQATVAKPPQEIQAMWAGMIDELEKIAIMATMRSGWKALRSSVPGLGKTKLMPGGPGILQASRQQAVQLGSGLIQNLQRGGVPVQRARVKTPESMIAKGMQEGAGVPDDLLGMQFYANSPLDVARAARTLQRSGVSGLDVQPKIRTGYHGVNIKGNLQGVPLELQASPSITSNVGQQMEHTLGYKVDTETPDATSFDRWVGKQIAPRLVRSGSWLRNQEEQDLLQFVRARVQAQRT